MHTFSKMRLCLMALMLGLFTVTSAWAGFNIWNNEYTVSKKELQQAISTRFPRNVGDKNTIQMQLSNPVLDLDATHNRFVITLNTIIAGPLLQKPIQGMITVSSSIQYDPNRLAVTLLNPSIDKTTFNDVDSNTNQQISLFSNMLVQQMLNHYAVYTFTPDQLKFAGQTYQPTSITVESDQIRVQLEKATSPSNG